MDTLRLFLAIDIDKDGVDKIKQLQEHLKVYTNVVKWTACETWHITLKFLGEVQQNMLNSIIPICKNIANNFNTFEIALNSVGVFPEKRHPRILFLDTEPSLTLVQLQLQIENQLLEIGFPNEKREFHPHITLGRVKEPSKLFSESKVFLDKFAKAGKKFKYKFLAKQFCLYQSILQKEGPIYTPVEIFNLHQPFL